MQGRRAAWLQVARQLADIWAKHPRAASVPEEARDTYWSLAWRRLKRHRLARLGAAYLAALAIVSLLAPFLSPYDPNTPHLRMAYSPPQRLHWVDANGQPRWPPFTYRLELTLDPETWSEVYVEDQSRPYSVRFFSRGWEYRLGPFRSNIHLFTVEQGGTIFLLGTDKLGRDLFSRILHGATITLLVATAATIVSVLIGSVLGGMSGFLGGKVDLVVQRAVEVVQSIPALPLFMALSAAIPSQWPSEWTLAAVTLVFASQGWTWLAREVRGKVLYLREQDFIVAARAIGARDGHILVRHVLPNAISHIIVIASISIPELILAESALGFLGLGVQPPLVSWGVLLRDASNLHTIGRYPWLLLPGLVVLVTVLAFNFLGDGLRDAADPYSDRQ